MSTETYNHNTHEFLMQTVPEYRQAWRETAASSPWPARRHPPATPAAKQDPDERVMRKATATCVAFIAFTGEAAEPMDFLPYVHALIHMGIPL
jgi:hypothetical protein